MSAPEKLTMQDLQDLGIIPDAAQVGERGRPSSALISDKGSFSEVYEHPTDPSLAVRIADPNDGWISYALDNHGSQHAPRLDQLGWYQDRWIAVVERLQPYNPSGIEEHLSLRGAVNAMLGADRGLFPADVEACGRYPGLAEYLEQFRDMPKLDRWVTNVMVRGDPGSLMPIFNDPIPVTPDERIPPLQDAWSVDLPVLEDPFVADLEIGTLPQPNGPR